MNFDKDSVVNFLTPTKLVHTSVKTKPRPLLQEPLRTDSQQSNNTKSSRLYPSNQRTDLPTYSFTANFDKIHSNVSRNQSEEGLHSRPKERSRPPTDRNSIVSNSRSVMKEEDHFKIGSHDTFKLNIENNPKVNPQESLGQDIYQRKTPNSSVLKLESVDYAPVGEVLARINNSQRSSRMRETIVEGEKERNEDFSRIGEGRRDVFKLDGSVEGLKELMASLKEVKDLIDGELGELQRLLDNTSKYLNDVNQQYLNIKERILKYTSQVLDASFRKYKENMVNWMKYEQVQKKAIAMVAQLEKNIIEDEIVVKQISRATTLPRVAVAKQQQIAEKVDFYQNFCHELRAIKSECLSMRPQLKKERILDFEKALALLAQF